MPICIINVFAAHKAKSGNVYAYTASYLSQNSKKNKLANLFNYKLMRSLQVAVLCK
ncbi:hypothetical protein [Fischerella sp. JS2]|uniref:hypothetical protein n=1 Tax=Fischerella sp. JS2 TaxID=2597771 RepID=UPI0028E4C17F|nr:hypothetical protein [Fischerella sp. JS2]